MKIIKTNILNPISSSQVEYLKDIFLTIENGKIFSISKETKTSDFTDHSDCVCIPGLIDTHVHLSQYYARGKHNSNLMDWLHFYIFPEELKSKSPEFAKKVAQDFFKDSVSKGTTTSVIYTAPFKDACEIAFEIAEKTGVRVIMGKTMMDLFSPAFLQKSTEASFKDSVELYQKWNQKTELLEYIFSPRFAPVCSSKLMKLVGKFAHENNAYIQTHLSESKKEIKLVKELFPKFESYTEVYEKHELLGPKTILGHVIHVDDKEIEIIRKSRSKIAHCPDSNFFLRSGIFPYEKIKKSNIEFALASDVAAGTSISMLNVMKMCNYRQDNYIVSPTEAFYYATLGGAKVLEKEEIIGSIQVGKDADLTFIKIPEIENKEKENILSELMYLGTEREIKATFVAGKPVFQS
jgi:guanine deaminase